MEITVSQLLQLLVFLGAIVLHWTRTQVSLRALEVKIAMIENSIQQMQKEDDKIMAKLDSISDQINELRIELNNKQDRL